MHKKKLTIKFSTTAGMLTMILTWLGSEMRRRMWRTAKVTASSTMETFLRNLGLEGRQDMLESTMVV